MNRYTATLYHFLGSAVVLALLGTLVISVWFPGFFFEIDGGREGLGLIILVGLVTGPLLTLIVFKPGKKGLAFDLLLIGLLQAVCLAAGVFIVYSERPTFFIYYERHFYSTSADSYLEYGVEPPDPEAFGGAPAMVFVDLPSNPIEEAGVRRIFYADNVPLWTFSRYYERLDRNMDTVIEQGLGKARVRERDQDGNLEPWLERHGGTFDDYAFVPIHSRYRNVLLGIRKSDGSFVDVLEIVPPVPPSAVELVEQQ